MYVEKLISFDLFLDEQKYSSYFIQKQSGTRQFNWLKITYLYETLTFSCESFISLM
jgi:hypothetical protein